MTLFTDDPSPRALTSMPVEQVGRYVLHRAGIRNVWQYDDVEFLFAGGRMLLRGRNGAGKSKGMEMLLPLLLDGDTRSLDCAGRDRTTLGWLMTDGREGTVHIGYVWLELRLVDADGTATFRTLGCGVKASASTRKATVWFFVTDKRVGDTLLLEDGAGMLSQDAFRTQLGPDEYFTVSATYACRVARELFGIEDEGRYRNLCHLLYELRRPSVGEHIEAGRHAEVLSEALPPLDDDLIAEIARNFDDLTQVREDLARSERTERAVSEFLDSYRDYTRGVLRNRARQVGDAAEAAADTRRVMGRALQEAERTGRALDDTQGRVNDLDAQGRSAQAELTVLRAQPAYRHAQSIDDRKRRVEAHRSAALIAEEAAASSREYEHQAAWTASKTAEAVADEAQHTMSALAELERPAIAARIDPCLLGSGIRFVDGTATRAEQVLIRHVDGSTERIDRSQPRRADIDAVGAAVSHHDEDLAGVARTAASRRVAVGILIDEVRGVEATRREAGRAEQQAADAETQLSKAAKEERRACEAAVAADRGWRTGVATWAAHETCQRLDRGWGSVISYTTTPDGDDPPALLSPADIEDIEALIDARFDPASTDAQAAHSDAVAELRRVERVLAALTDERDEIEARSEKSPAPSPYRSALRDRDAGAPLYSLVDFAAGLDPAAAAGMEAALEASGLLDSWVCRDGTVVDRATRDVVLHPNPLPEDIPTLARVLTPSLPPGSPVTASTVAVVLASIGLGDTTAANSWVTTDGQWGLGIAQGAWAKDRPEYVGIGARRAARERELAAIAVRINEAEALVVAAEQVARDARQWAEDLDRARRALPSARDMLDALAGLTTRRSVTAEARRDFEMLWIAAQQARDGAAQAERAVKEKADGQDLPHELADLTDLDRALGEFAQCIRSARGHSAQVTRALNAHREATTAWEEAMEARRAREATADRLRDVFDDEAGQLATLEDAFGDDAKTIMRKVDKAQADLEEAERLLPGARNQLLEAGSAHALAEQEARRMRTAVEEAESRAAAEIDALGRVLTTPGLVLAAFGPDALALAVPEDTSNGDGAARVRQLRNFATRVADATASSREISDGAILKRYEALGPGLAGGYDAAVDETPEGVKVFELHDDTGHHPIAVVGRRLTKEVAEAKGRLTKRQQEVFERFLLGELGDHVRHQLLDADTLCSAMNSALEGVRTSHGLGVKLKWHVSEDAPVEAVEALPLLRQAPGIRGAEKNQCLGQLLGTLIEAARAAEPAASYESHLRTALDYRRWHTFTVSVVDDANSNRSRRLDARIAVSQGEQRVLAYLALFSGAAAYFDSLKRRAPYAPRVILLDDAFAKIDEPTHGRLLALLVALDLDFIITSERVTGCVPGLSLEIYECLRDRHVRGIALVHTHWDGQRAQLHAV